MDALCMRPCKSSSSFFFLSLVRSDRLTSRGWAYVCSARVLGGSSMISDVLWQRPSREEFDVWGTELGNGPTWSFDTLEPYYRKAENWTGPPIKTLPGGQKDHALGKVFGRNGPMQISYNNYYPGLIEESVAAANNLGARTSSNPVSPFFLIPKLGVFFFLAPALAQALDWHSPWKQKLTLKRSLRFSGNW
jgi:hypothetical protein